MTSKKRRKAREWMHAERERHDRQADGLLRRVHAEYDRAREELTRYIFVRADKYGRDDVGGRHFLLGTQPEQPYVKVVVPPQHFAGIPTIDQAMHLMPFDHIRPITFRAVREGWNDGAGFTVHWWRWELCR